MTTKLYNTRDSATSALRKLGVKPRDYDLFITKVDGKFECRVGAAADHLRSLTQPAVKAPAPKRRDKAVETTGSSDKEDKAPTTAKKAGISQTARDLILAGKTNAEVWASLQAQFGLGDDKKHYPSWYRCELKRKGLLAA